MQELTDRIGSSYFGTTAMMAFSHRDLVFWNKSVLFCTLGILEYIIADPAGSKAVLYVEEIISAREENDKEYGYR